MHSSLRKASSFDAVSAPLRGWDGWSDKSQNVDNQQEEKRRRGLRFFPVHFELVVSHAGKNLALHAAGPDGSIAASGGDPRPFVHLPSLSPPHCAVFLPPRFVYAARNPADELRLWSFTSAPSKDAPELRRAERARFHASSGT